MTEIPGSPLSRHDLNVLHNELIKARARFDTVTEIHISSTRLATGNLRVFGIPLLTRDELGLNEGLLIVEGKPPIHFDLENA